MAVIDKITVSDQVQSRPAQLRNTLITIAAIAIFGPKFRIKGLDVLGFKVEFPEPKAEPGVPALPRAPRQLPQLRQSLSIPTWSAS